MTDQKNLFLEHPGTKHRKARRVCGLGEGVAPQICEINLGSSVKTSGSNIFA
jgi:hypothetical protein